MASFESRVMDIVAPELDDIRRLFLPDSGNCSNVDLQPVIDKIDECCTRMREQLERAAAEQHAEQANHPQEKEQQKEAEARDLVSLERGELQAYIDACKNDVDADKWKRIHAASRKAGEFLLPRKVRDFLRKLQASSLGIEHLDPDDPLVLEYADAVIGTYTAPLVDLIIPKSKGEMLFRVLEKVVDPSPALEQQRPLQLENRLDEQSMLLDRIERQIANLETGCGCIGPYFSAMEDSIRRAGANRPFPTA